MASDPGRFALTPEARGALPPVYVDVLLSVAEGADDASLAARAGVDPAAVAALVRLALAKLLEVQAAHSERSLARS